MKKKTKFPAPYIAIEKIDDLVILYNNRGEYSVVMSIVNPVQKFSSDADGYLRFNQTMSEIIKTLGTGYTLQKHDIFSRQKFSPNEKCDSFLQKSYFTYFDGREYMKHFSYLTLTQERKKAVFQYDAAKWKDFLSKAKKIIDILNSDGFSPRILKEKELNSFLYRYFCVNFKDETFSVKNMSCNERYLMQDKTKIQSTSIINIDEVDLPPAISPFHSEIINGSEFFNDLFSFLSEVPFVDSLIYHQAIFIPNQKIEAAKLAKKKNRHRSLPSAPNLISADEIEAVEAEIASENKLFVYTHYNVICCGKDLEKSISFIESSFAKRGFICSSANYNQSDLFFASLPGCANRTNKDYDRFLTMQDTAGCFFYKEHDKKSETTPVKVYYTDRRGIPIAIDITGKEGEARLTTNSNFFCLGPSGSGKSFHMNSVVRQLYEQNTDIVLVDTGHSYKSLCEYAGGRYITYTDENPISMNPFLITKEELNIEKINFLKSLIFVIWKGAKGQSNEVEDEFIERVIRNYYRFYFDPFNSYTDEERQARTSKLLLEANPLSSHQNAHLFNEKMKAKIDRVKQLAIGGVGGEQENAKSILLNLTSKIDEIPDNEVLLDVIHQQIETEENRLRNIKVESLSFNSFYEFCLQYIPFLIETTKINFDLDQFVFLLSKFYKGGSMEKTLNQNMDSTLFDSKFIVFEIDAIKDDPKLFPIVTLIIMDVFLQKMRLKKNRKALVIEEAWKAIASDLMAGYILYLYKTVRKFWGIVGVVTQEVEDIISSPIVKSAILNNSEIVILLDQSKLRDRFGAIRPLFNLTDAECSKIWTINNLPNKDNRGRFSEVYIKRGSVGDVFGVEESPQAYMAYTTERVEKDALSIYQNKYGSIEEAIKKFCEDWKASGIKSCIDFSKSILSNNEN